jgi:biopolymer transport protein ExbB
MKSFVSVLLALGLSVACLMAQAPAGNQPKPIEPPKSATAANAAPSKDQAVTRINGPGAQAPGKPANAAGKAGYIPAEKGEPMNLWKVISEGGWIMIPLGVMSFLTVMLVLVFLLTLRRSAIMTSHYMNTADVLLKKRDYLGLLAISARHSEAVASVVQRTLDFATKNPSATFDTVKEVAQSEGNSQASSLQHKVTYLADIGAISPMVGLFGTVIGMIKSFGSLGSGDVSQNRDWAMASGVSEALIATAGGLIIGIVAFAFYAYFRNKVQRLISDLEVASSHVIGLIALNYNKKREASRAALDDEF